VLYFCSTLFSFYSTLVSLHKDVDVEIIEQFIIRGNDTEAQEFCHSKSEIVGTLFTD